MPGRHFLLNGRKKIVIKEQSESEGERDQLMVKQLFQHKALSGALNLIEINSIQKYFFLFWSSFFKVCRRPGETLLIMLFLRK